MGHYVHNMSGEGRSPGSPGKVREVGALKHELDKVLRSLEQRRRAQLGAPSGALVAHAKQLMAMLEWHLLGPVGVPARQAEAIALRARLARLDAPSEPLELS